MKPLHILTVSVLLAALPCSASFASTRGVYLSASAGGTFMPDLTFRSASTSQLEHFGLGYTVGGAAGYDFGSGWRLQIDSRYQSQVMTALGGTTSLKGHLYSTGVIFGAQFDVLRHASIMPYLGFGIGLQNVGGSINGFKGRAWVPAYQVEAGLRGDMTRHVSSFLEYRVNRGTSVTLRNGGNSAQQQVIDHELMLGFTYHIGNR